MEELMLQFLTKNHLLENLLLFWISKSFVLFKTSTDWVRPTYTMGSNLLYSKSTCFDLISCKNIIREIFRIMFRPMSGNCGPGRTQALMFSLYHKDRTWQVSHIIIALHLNLSLWDVTALIAKSHVSWHPKK